MPQFPNGLLVPEVCYNHQQFEIDQDRIASNSGPVPEMGKYSIDWASAVEPEELAICIKKLMIYYNGPKNTACCVGWQMSDIKYPLGRSPLIRLASSEFSNGSKN